MKRKIVAMLTGLMIGVSAVAVVTPSVTAEAATLANGSAVNSVPVAGWVQSGTTAQNLLLKTAAGDFSIVLDKNCVFNNTKYLVPGEIVVMDIYVGADNKYHAADFQQNTVNANQNGAVAVGTAQAADVATASNTAKPSSSSNASSNPNVQVIYTKSINGGVEDKSTNTTLYAVADGTEYVFTMDDKTDNSNAKIIVPKYTYRIEFYRGDGKYNHVARITDLSGNNVGTGKGVSAATTTITGTVLSNTKQNEIYLKLSNQDAPAIIKVDATTDTSACRVVKPGQVLSITVGSGPDKYLHALSITDKTRETTSEGRMGDQGMVDSPAQIVNLPVGTFTADSNDDIAKISVGGQEYQLRVDSGSKGTNVPAVRPGWSYNASVYLGTDGYLHLKSFGDASGHTAYNVRLSGSTYTYTGTIDKSSTPNELHLTPLNSKSYLKIRLDSSTDTSKCKVLRNGKTVTVTCQRGSDRYLHATAIERAE